MHNLKKCAVLLGSINEHDRQRLLSELPQESAVRIRTLLKELEENKISRQIENSSQFERYMSDLIRDSRYEDEALKKNITQVNRMSAIEVRRVFKDEDEQYVKLIMACENWLWKDDFEKIMADEKGYSVDLRGCLEMVVPDKLKFSVIKCFVEKVSNNLQ